MIEFRGAIRSTTPFTVDAPFEVRGLLAAFAERYDTATIRVMPVRKARTTGERSQSHHFNGHIQTIAMETGNDFQAIKEVAKMRAVSMGYPFKSYRGITIPQSEADASTVECALLIDAVHLLAAEEGISLVEYD